MTGINPFRGFILPIEGGWQLFLVNIPGDFEFVVWLSCQQEILVYVVYVLKKYDEFQHIRHEIGDIGVDG